MAPLLLQVAAEVPHTLNEEALLALGALCQGMESAFLPFAPATLALALQGARNVQEPEACHVSLALLGHVFKVAPGLPADAMASVMECVFAALRHPTASVLVQSAALSCCGDAALLLGVEAVRPYLPTMRGAVEAFVGVAAGDGGEAHAESDEAEALRSALTEAFTGLCQGCCEDQPALFMEFAEPMMKLLALQARHVERLPDSELRASVGLIGDLAKYLSRTNFHRVLKQPAFKPLLKAARFSPSEMTRETAEYADGELQS